MKIKFLIPLLLLAVIGLSSFDSKVKVLTPPDGSEQNGILPSEDHETPDTINNSIDQEVQSLIDASFKLNPGPFAMHVSSKPISFSAKGLDFLPSYKSDCNEECFPYGQNCWQCFNKDCTYVWIGSNCKKIISPA